MPPYPPILCANCIEPFISTSKQEAFCSLRCRSAAKAVRYARKKFAEFGDNPIPADISEAMTFKFAHAASGGYDEAARRLTPEVRAQVKLRDGGKCVQCGAAGEDIDHIDGPSSDMSNLQLLCKQCHNRKTMKHIGPTEDDATREYATELRVRSLMPYPYTPGDHINWKTLRREWFDTCVLLGADEWSLAWPAWLEEQVEISDTEFLDG